MKKVITILAIMIVVIGAVFADPAPTGSEDHKIRIMADVTDVLPVFQLKIKDTTIITNNGEVKAAVYSDHFDSTAKDNSSAYDVQFNLNENGSVTFQAIIQNKAKSTSAKYTVLFSGGEFEVKKNGVVVSTKHSPSINVSPTTTDIAGIKSVTSGTADNSVVVEFKGTMTTENNVIATAVYTYTGDAAIDPGVYYADVVMTVSGS